MGVRLGLNGFPKSLDVSKAIDKAARGFPQGSTRTDPENPNAGRYKSQGSEGKRGEDDKGRGFGAGPGQFLKPGDVDPASGRKVVGRRRFADGSAARETAGVSHDVYGDFKGAPVVTEPSSEDAMRWQGWGTALKPAHEPIVVARKPLSERNVAANVLQHGTGAINVDASRVASLEKVNAGKGHIGYHGASEGYTLGTGREHSFDGRWPANFALVHADGCTLVGKKRVRTSDPRRADGSVNASFGTQGIYSGADSAGLDKPFYADEDGREEVEVWECVEGCPVRALDEQSVERGMHSAGGPLSRNLEWQRHDFGATSYSMRGGGARIGDAGGASRFFYTAKAARSEREAGLLGKAPCAKCFGIHSIEHRMCSGCSLNVEGESVFCSACGSPTAGEQQCIRNSHPTVKPMELMRWLVRLVTPPGGIVLDPFAGSGTSGCAAEIEGLRFVGIEQDADSALVAEARIEFWATHGEKALAMSREVRAAREQSEPDDPTHEQLGFVL